MKLFNVGLGKGYTVLELINTFEKVVGQKVPYSFGDRRKEISLLSILIIAK